MTTSQQRNKMAKHEVKQIKVMVYHLNKNIERNEKVLQMAWTALYAGVNDVNREKLEVKDGDLELDAPTEVRFPGLE
ncbi:hypothetical protein N0V90_005269 [Kalmusia sp. IMI 367209]|nr:hypothetical protein N0V90_005269 [Kalmusia sp. IMI 367209]